MSTVSGTSSSSDLYSILQSLRNSRSSSTSQTDETGSTSSSEKPKRPGEVMAEALKEQGLDDDQISEIQSKIKDLMKQTKESGGSPEDMKDSINSILKDYGVDSDKVESYMQSNMPQGGPGGMGGMGGPPPMQLGNNTADGVTNTVDMYA